jgi:hypothetical protein
MSNNEDNIYHKVGQFWTHFQEDMDAITGDMIIMSKGSYDEADIARFNGDDDDDDNGDDRWMIRFPREY